MFYFLQLFELKKIMGAFNKYFKLFRRSAEINRSSLAKQQADKDMFYKNNALAEPRT
jgi:hypothetical protein